MCEQHRDSARTLAAAVLLEVDGLRAKADGSHATLAEAVGEQFGGPFQRLNRYRRMGHAAEYPTPQDPRTGSADARQALADCAEIVAGARRLVSTAAIPLRGGNDAPLGTDSAAPSPRSAASGGGADAARS